MKDTRKDLLDLDTERNIDFEENSPYQEGIISKTYERPDKSYFKEPSEFKDLGYYQISTKISTKTNRYRQDLRHYKEKSTKRNTFTHYNQRNSSRLFNQSLLQRPILVISTEQVTKQKKYHMQRRNLSRKIHLTRFITVQIGNYTR